MKKKHLIRALNLYFMLRDLEKNWVSDHLDGEKPTIIELGGGYSFSFHTRQQVTNHCEMAERDLRGAINVSCCPRLSD